MGRLVRSLRVGPGGLFVGVQEWVRYWPGCNCEYPRDQDGCEPMALDLASMEPAVLEAIDAIRPALQSDGGDIVFREIDAD